MGALVKWFGTNLGCSDNSIEVYGPDEEQPNMKIVHQNMGISQAEFDGFNDALIGLLKMVPGTSVGLPDAVAAKVRIFLDVTSPDICALCDDYDAPSLCEKWATASQTYKGDQKKMLEDVVVGVFTALTSGEHAAIGKAFFDGTTPCNSRDFVGDTVQRLGLVRSLVAFFGSAGALGCTQAGFPQYRGQTDMDIVHKFMPINKALFDAFVTTLGSVVTGALSADVPDLAADIDAVVALLYSEGIYKTCNQADCNVMGLVGGSYTEKTCPAPPSPPGPPGAPMPAPAPGPPGAPNPPGPPGAPGMTPETTSAAAPLLAVAVSLAALLAAC